jgi:subtilisin family serine protease
MKKPDLSQEFCELPHFEREDLLSAQSIGQQFGWQIANYDLPSAWKETCGEGVTIAILDTGVDLTHPDLAPNLLPGYNVITPNLPPQDDNGHGSHVAGIIAACNNDIGVVGVANCCKILPVKVLNRVGAGRMDHVVRGIKWAVENGADIICMSLGTRNPLEEVYATIKDAANKGVICFVAAGNAGQTTQLLYPAAYDITISIGAIDEQSMRASFSCTGPNLDFVAPGVNIYSTVPPSNYAIMNGTSQATPFACGVAALILAYRRKTSPGLKMSKEEYVAAMRYNALSIQNLDAKYAELGNRFFQGFGIINPQAMIEWLENKKVDGVAQMLGGIISDVGMINRNANVDILRNMVATLNEKLATFIKTEVKPVIPPEKEDHLKLQQIPSPTPANS